MLTTQSAPQYFARPEDEKFKSLEDLYAAALHDAKHCKRADVPLSAIEAIPQGRDVAIRGKATGLVAQLNHWSFAQLSRMVGAPAYLRTLPADLAVQNLNHGLKLERGDDDLSQLYLRPTADSGFTLRAITTPKYTRYHDASFVSRMMQLKDTRPGLDLPPVWGGGNGGAYRGDRDCFVIMVDGGSIVNDPTVSRHSSGADGTMYRGIIGRNSEVGGSQFELLTFYFRGICGNHAIWGVENAVNTKRRHVGDVAKAAEQMIRDAMKFFESSAAEDVQRIEQLNTIELGKDKDAVVVAGRSAGLTEEEAEDSYDAAEQYEQNPRSIWGYSNGITRISQQADYQDARFEMDLIAAKLLRRKLHVSAAVRP